MRLSDEAEACRRQPGQTTNMEKMDKQVMNNNKPRLVEDSLDRQTTNKETRQTGNKETFTKKRMSWNKRNMYKLAELKQMADDIGAGQTINKSYATS